MAGRGTESWQLCLEVLTPLHVGSGFTLLRDNDFLLRGDGAPFVVDLNRTLAELAGGDQDLAAVVGQSARLGDVVKVCGEEYGYALPLYGGLDAAKVRGVSEVRGHIKDAFFRPYLPGSSLKGAIRTALLARAMENGSPDYRGLLPTRGDNTRDKFAAQKLTEGVFSPGAPRGKTPNHDLLRALHVGDALFEVGELQLIDVRWMNLMAAGWGWREMGGAKRTLPAWRDANGILGEALPPGTTASFALQVDRFLTDDPLVRRTLGWDTANATLPALASFAALRELLNAHARRRLAAELAFFRAHRVAGAAQACERLLAEMSATPEAAFVRVGWGNGWAGMTGDWLDAATTQAMREKFNLGKRGSEVFPKTRRLVVHGTEPCLPLGWIRLHSPAASQALAAERRRQREAVQTAERLQAEASAREAAEVTARAAAEAALTDEERALRDLRLRLERAAGPDLQPGGPLAGALNLALQAADAWPTEKKRQLADLAEAVWNRIGWGKGAKKAAKQARLATLRGS